MRGRRRGQNGFREHTRHCHCRQIAGVIACLVGPAAFNGYFVGGLTLLRSSSNLEAKPALGMFRYQDKWSTQRPQNCPLSQHKKKGHDLTFTYSSDSAGQTPRTP